MHFLLFAPGLAAGLPTEAEVFAGVLARFDADGSGTISATEYARFDTEAAFASMDLDASGDIDVAELTAWVKVTQPRPITERRDGPGEKRAPPDEILVQVVDPEGVLAAPAAPGGLLTLHIGASADAAAVPLNDAGTGVDIAAGDGVYAGLAPRPKPGEAPVELRAAGRTWRGRVAFDAATSNVAVPLTPGPDDTLRAFAGAVPIGASRGGSRSPPPSTRSTPGSPPPSPPSSAPPPPAPSSPATAPATAPAEAEPASLLPRGWPWFAAILGVGGVVGGWLELRGRARRRRRGRGGRRW